MNKFQVLGVAALALLMLASDATAQRGGGAVRGGARGAVVGGLVGGESGAATGAKIGAVTGAARSVGAEAQARAQYQASAAYRALRARISIKHRRRCWSPLHRRRRPPHRRL